MRRLHRHSLRHERGGLRLFARSGIALAYAALYSSLLDLP